MLNTSSRHVAFVVMTDSYAKWAAGLLETMPADWQCSFTAVEHQQAPSHQQLADALSGFPVAMALITHSSLSALLRQWSKNPPHVIVAAGPGPFMLALRQKLDRTSWGYSIPMVGGSPGIAIHLGTDSLRFRQALDVLVVASHREYEVLGYKMRAGFHYCPTIALSTLPFIEGVQPRTATADSQEFVFAAQPDIPASKNERLKLLRDLIAFKRKHALDCITIKLRARSGEAQTHTEFWSYPDLFNELVTAGDATRNEVRFVHGSMRDALRHPHAILATVSSSAAIESIALGNPTLIIANAGVAESLANDVFTESGLIHRLEEVSLPYQGVPQDAWKAANYFHPASDNTLLSILTNVQSRMAPKLTDSFSVQQLRKNAISEALRSGLPKLSAPLFRLLRALTRR